MPNDLDAVIAAYHEAAAEFVEAILPPTRPCSRSATM